MYAPSEEKAVAAFEYMPISRAVTGVFGPPPRWSPARTRRPQEDAFHQREDGRGGANAESQRENDGQREAWRLPQSAKREAKIPCGCVHASSWNLGFFSKLCGQA